MHGNAFCWVADAFLSIQYVSWHRQWNHPVNDVCDDVYLHKIYHVLSNDEKQLIKFKRNRRRPPAAFGFIVESRSISSYHGSNQRMMNTDSRVLFSNDRVGNRY